MPRGTGFNRYVVSHGEARAVEASMTDEELNLLHPNGFLYRNRAAVVNATEERRRGVPVLTTNLDSFYL